MARNPIGFTPGPVTFFTTLVYAALITALLVVHLVVPEAPAAASIQHVNITEAWSDLQFLSNGYHPFNSRRNVEVRNWLLRRLDAILADNGASVSASDDTGASESTAVVFNDMTSNLTSSYGAITTYFEGTNLIVYIRGVRDDDGPWWESEKIEGPGGVLVNAHYDSVSTGYGATDDGVGVVSILQLIRYFTTPGSQPERGLVALFNNGEEDYLNGARVFGVHPVSRFPRVFVNLEGAGAGGRATMFRSTDSEVTKFYRGTKHPFGTIVSSDGFKRGFVRSQTDYVVFNGNLDMRGLDIAFMEPRSRYHTDQDDTRHTSIDSLWHMLSAALHTTRGLTSDTDTSFDRDAGSDAVWFDLFGSTLVVFNLHTLFALSVTLLVVAPVALIGISVVLSNNDKLYMFSFSKSIQPSAGDEDIRIRGLHGFFRFPFIFLVPSACLVGLAFLMNEVNPYIAYSSPYAVWSMMLSAWFFAAWFLSRSGDFARPSALHRAYSWLWMFVLFWAILVAYTVYEDRIQLASGYFLVWYFFVIALATFISFLEQFGLEKKAEYAERQLEASGEMSRRPGSSQSRRTAGSTAGSNRRSGEGGSVDAEDDDDEAQEESTETTSLIRGPKKTTFANYSSSMPDTDDEENPSARANSSVYGYEQDWSANLPSWSWILQLLIVAPITIVLVGQIGLLLATASYQTSADGNPPIAVYLIIAVFSVLILAPITPFIHRYTFHIPTFLLLVFVATLIYNLLAFPYSANNRLKIYFVQRVDLDSGVNAVGLSGVGSPYLDRVVDSLPSSAGKKINRLSSVRSDLVEYSWEGLPPRVVPNLHPLLPPAAGYADWLSFNVTREAGKNAARFSVHGTNTRSCRIHFNAPMSDLTVLGSDLDERFEKIGKGGSRELRLWSREWDHTWTVDVAWPSGGGRKKGEEGRDGKVVCLWNDNGDKLIDALEEVRNFAPDWAVVIKLGDGLVEGSKAFLI